MLYNDIKTLSADDYRKLARIARKTAIKSDDENCARTMRALAIKSEKLAKMSEFGRLLNQTLND